MTLFLLQVSDGENYSLRQSFGPVHVEVPVKEISV